MEHNGATTALASSLERRRTTLVHELKAHFSFATLLAILFLTFLDNTIASAVLTSVQSKLHAGVSELQWVVGGYALAFASLMLICGSLGDNFGRKRIMLIGVAIFCCGSVVCAFSDTPTQLIIGRVIMGVGAAGSEPSTLSMIRHIYPDRRLRARALGAWAAVSGLALALGPVIGGILVGLWTWRSVFWFNFIFGGVVLVVGTIALPESVNEIRRRIDVPGFILAAIALGCATFATIAGETWGYYSSSVLSLYSIAGLSFLVYFVVESRTKFPMLNVRWVTNRAFAGSTVIAFTSYFAIFSIFFFVALYLEVVASVSAYSLAVDFLPLLGGMIAASLFAGRWVGRVGSRVPLTVGCLLAGVGRTSHRRRHRPPRRTVHARLDHGSRGHRFWHHRRADQRHRAHQHARGELRHGRVHHQYEPRTRRSDGRGGAGFHRERPADRQSDAQTHCTRRPQEFST